LFAVIDALASLSLIRPKNKRHVAAFIAKYEIEQVQVFAYHLAANRIVEQRHKPIVDALAKLINSRLSN